MHSTPLITLALALCSSVLAGAIVSDPNNLPYHSENGQSGYNQCDPSTENSSSMCQNVYINSLDDFCLFAPPSPHTVGDSEQYEVAYCTKAGHGTRLIEPGTITSAHFINSRNYVQIVGTGDFTKLNIVNRDEGGELDPHGADGTGNPIGGLVLGSHDGKLIQYTEWTSFISYNQFCIRACFPETGGNAPRNCNHIYDVMGCEWNMPANYDGTGFDTCNSDDPREPMGVYQQDDGSLSTFYQGQAYTPPAQPAPSSSQCVKQYTAPGAAYATKATPIGSVSPVPSATITSAPATKTSKITKKKKKTKKAKKTQS